MKASGMLSVMLLAASTSAFPVAFPQGWSWPSWPPSSGGGGSGGGSGSGGSGTDIDNGVCKDLTVIFARGTSEPGILGSVGTPLLNSLNTNVGKDRVAFQGVPYAASPAGNAQNGGDGPKKMIDLANKARQQCAKTKIVLSGYSQGGIVVHAAGSSLASNKPIGAVIFGDPYNGRPVDNVPNLKEFCNKGDGVCDRSAGGGITAPHTTYGRDGSADNAAKWIATLL